MTRILPILVLLVSCASPSDRMVYKADDYDQWCVGQRSGLWFGDCEDYAFTKKREIGGEVWHVVLPTGAHHAVLLTNGVVYDQDHAGGVSMGEYKATWLFIMTPDPSNECDPIPVF